jgi:hypothetical protein
MTDKPLPGGGLAVARRLRIVEKYSGFQTGKAFALDLDILDSRWANMKSGLPLTYEVAEKIVRRYPGITFDWLWLGHPGGLPVHLQRRLTDLDRELVQKRSSLPRKPKETRG